MSVAMAIRWRVRWFHVLLAFGLLIVLFGAHPSSRGRSREYINDLARHWGWRKPSWHEMRPYGDGPALPPMEEPASPQHAPAESEPVEPESVEPEPVEPTPTPAAESATEAPKPDEPPPVDDGGPIVRPHDKMFYQGDIEYTVPDFDLVTLSRKNPHNYKGPGHPTYATYYATRNASNKDSYFIATQQVIYRTLWDPRSKSAHYPITVFVAPFVSQEQRDYFAAAGAIVREIPLLPFVSLDGWLTDRLQDVKSKLLMWNQTDFSRMIFLDSDAFPWENCDHMVGEEVSPLQKCKWDLLEEQDKKRITPDSETCEYVFSAYFETEDMPNAGVMVLKPDRVLFEMVMRIADNQTSYDNGFPEQGPLSILYRHDGPFPPSPNLGFAYNGGPDRVLAGKPLYVMHSKIWAMYWDENQFVRHDFNATWLTMLDLYESEHFVQMRNEDDANGR